MQAAAFPHLACLHMEGSSAEKLVWRMSWEGGSETRLYYRGYLSRRGQVQDVPKQLRTVGARVYEQRFDGCRFYCFSRPGNWDSPALKPERQQIRVVRRERVAGLTTGQREERQGVALHP